MVLYKNEGKVRAMYCYKCKNQIRDDARFCNFCGADQSAASAEQPVMQNSEPVAAPVTQPAAAPFTQQPAAAPFSQQPAATPFAQQPAAAPVAPAAPAGKPVNGKIKTLLPIIIAAVILVIAIIVFALSRSGSDDTPVLNDPTVAPTMQSESEITTENTVVLPPETQPTEAVQTEAVQTEAVQTTPEVPVNNGTSTVFADFSVQKIGSLNIDGFYSPRMAKGGIYYRDSDTNKYGILSYDSKKDSGAIYTSCTEEGKYFEVSKNDMGAAPAVDGLNSVGLVDAEGNVLVPFEYATMDVLSDRFVKVTKVKGVTDNEDEALVFYSENTFAFAPGEDDILLKGVWYIYDMEKGRLIPGVSGTKAYYSYAYGNFVQYVNDQEESVYVDADGVALPENAAVYQNGFYKVETSVGGTVYDSNHNKLFAYSKDDYSMMTYSDGYMVGAKYDNGYTYYVLDNSGKIISAGFSSYVSIYGDLIFSDYKVYDFSGKQLVEGQFDSIYMDDTFRDVWFLKDNSEYTVIDRNGNVLYQGTESETLAVDCTSNFSVSKKQDNNQALYYSWAAKDFTLTGYAYAFAPWLIRSVDNADGTCNLIDTANGKTILQNYESYNKYVVDDDSVMYVLASNDNSSYDVYALR